MRGLFVTFEGVEGSGKSTQINLLRGVLEAEGHSVRATRCPGGEPVAEAIRSVLLHADTPVMPQTELLLFLAARSQVTARIILPQLEEGRIVLMDRFIDSSVVYQGYARGQDLDMVRSLNLFATGGLRPDCTILLDFDPEEGLSRQTDRNRMEEESLAFHQTVRAGYLAEARHDPERFRVIDAARSVEEILQDILVIIGGLLAARNETG
jgi:dTMP kinase